MGGKLIAVHNPVLHGDGSTVIACALGVAIETMTKSKTLLINAAGAMSNLGNYLKSEVDLKNNIDTLKAWGSDLKPEHISAYMTKISDSLDLLPGTRQTHLVQECDSDFDNALIDGVLSLYDYVVVDCATNYSPLNAIYLDRADVILSVVTPNRLELDSLFNRVTYEAVRGVIERENTLIVVNKIYDDIPTELKNLVDLYDLGDIFGIPNDGAVFSASCVTHSFNSFVKSELSKGNSAFTTRISQLTRILLKHFGVEPEEQKQHGLFSKILKGRAK